MQLQYRGNSYESHPQVIETYDTGITPLHLYIHKFDRTISIELRKGVNMK